MDGLTVGLGGGILQETKTRRSPGGLVSGRPDMQENAICQMDFGSGLYGQGAGSGPFWNR